MQPVLLVHGFKDDARKMRHLARYLETQGWAPQACTLAPSWGQVGIEVLAAQLSEYVEQHLSTGRPFDLVGFSMGGLICRYYLQRMGGLERVHRFVTIATPHRGTATAYFMDKPACRQMRPGSPFLSDLASDAHKLAQVGFTSLWTPLDAMIIPPSSSELPEARSRRVWSPGHPWMVTNREPLKAIAEALRDQ